MEFIELILKLTPLGGLTNIYDIISSLQLFINNSLDVVLDSISWTSSLGILDPITSLVTVMASLAIIRWLT